MDEWDDISGSLSKGMVYGFGDSDIVKSQFSNSFLSSSWTYLGSHYEIEISLNQVQKLIIWIQDEGSNTGGDAKRVHGHIWELISNNSTVNHITF